MDLLEPRYKCIADYPNNPFEVDEVIEVSEQVAKQMDDYPHLFRKLEWWENRKLDELLGIKYVKVVTYTGYWRVGDIVPVTDYEADLNSKKLNWFVLKYNRRVKVETVEPSTELVYNQFKL